MSNSTHDRIAAAFDRELAATPVPPALRSQSVHSAVIAQRPKSTQPRLLGLVAALLALAVVATLVMVSHGAHPTPVPAGSTTPPPARGGAGAAYDPVRAQLVLFGGNANPDLNETWTFDGKYWVQRHPAVSPQPRGYTVMAYDAANRDVVLFGGMAVVSTTGKPGAVPVDDTWTWNGTTWQERHPSHEPAFGYAWQSPTMGFDPISRTVLIYGFNASFKPETWSWNGTDWTQKTPSTTPTSIGTMVSDGREVLLVAGSPGLVGGRYLTQTWAWDGSNWNVLNPKVNLPLLGLVSSAYDPQRGQLVVLTGDTWTWDGSTWSRQHPALQPPSIGYMAYMPSLHEVISWGDVNSNRDNEMFAWDGTNWTLIEPGTVVSQNTAGKGNLGVMTPDQAAAAIRATVTNTHPVLLPTSLPGGPYDANVNADADGFSIQYESDLRDKTVNFGVVIANPPPGGANSSETHVKFRSGEADYFVYDTTASGSQRWIMWSESGAMVNPIGKVPTVVPYFLATSGLTDQEFWQIANSLK